MRVEEQSGGLGKYSVERGKERRGRETGGREGGGTQREGSGERGAEGGGIIASTCVRARGRTSVSAHIYAPLHACVQVCKRKITEVLYYVFM